jgi:hypothetical protein
VTPYGSAGGINIPRDGTTKLHGIAYQETVFLFVADDRKYVKNIKNSTSQSVWFKLKIHTITILGPHFDDPFKSWYYRLVLLL